MEGPGGQSVMTGGPMPTLKSSVECLDCPREFG